MDDHSIEDHKLWNLVTETWNALTNHFEPVVQNHIQTSNFNLRMWGLLLAVLTFEPESVSTADMMVRNPYTATDEFQARLSKAAQNGFLSSDDEGCSYQLTELGRGEARRLIDIARQVMTQVDPLPERDGLRLAKLFDRLVRASLETPPLPETWSIQLSYKMMPALPPPLPFSEQAITCLAAYRDDCHLAAWRRSGLSATALEMLTLVWRGETNTLDGVCQELAHRGHPRDVYERALSELGERGFISSLKTKLHVSDSGRLFRNQVETDTDHYFFAPWKALSYRDKTDLMGLLIRLKEGLTTD